MAKGVLLRKLPKDGLTEKVEDLCAKHGSIVLLLDRKDGPSSTQLDGLNCKVDYIVDDTRALQDPVKFGLCEELVE